MEFFRQEYWNWSPLRPAGDLPHPGIKLRSPALRADALTSEPPGKPKNTGVGCHSLLQEIFPTQGLNLGLLRCRQILYHLSHQRSPVEFLFFLHFLIYVSIIFLQTINIMLTFFLFPAMSSLVPFNMSSIFIMFTSLFFFYSNLYCLIFKLRLLSYLIWSLQFLRVYFFQRVHIFTNIFESLKKYMSDIFFCFWRDSSFAVSP